MVPQVVGVRTMSIGPTEAGVPRLLVVEDEESIRDFVEMGLRYEGFDVELTADGPSALTAFAQRRPSLDRDLQTIVQQTPRRREVSSSTVNSS